MRNMKLTYPHLKYQCHSLYCQIQTRIGNIQPNIDQRFFNRIVISFLITTQYHFQGNQYNINGCRNSQPNYLLNKLEELLACLNR
jgi:hypothetical protein